MVAALSPADINYDETLSTLRYALHHYATFHHDTCVLSLFVRCGERKIKYLKYSTKVTRKV